MTNQNVDVCLKNNIISWFFLVIKHIWLDTSNLELSPFFQLFKKISCGESFIAYERECHFILIPDNQKQKQSLCVSVWPHKPQRTWLKSRKVLSIDQVCYGGSCIVQAGILDWFPWTSYYSLRHSWSQSRQPFSPAAVQMARAWGIQSKPDCLGSPSLAHGMYPIIRGWLNWREEKLLFCLHRRIFCSYLLGLKSKFICLFLSLLLW